MLLLLLACATPTPQDAAAPDVSGRLPPPAEALTIELVLPDDVVPGAVIRVTIGGAEPGDPLALAGSVVGTFDDSCPPALGGGCVGLEDAFLVGHGTAGADGAHTFEVVVPDVRDDLWFYVQGLYADGAETMTSPARTTFVDAPERPIHPRWVSVWARLSLTDDGALTHWGSPHHGPFENELTVTLHQGERTCDLLYRIDAIEPGAWAPEMPWVVDLAGLTPVETDCLFADAVEDPWALGTALVQGLAIGPPSPAAESYIRDDLWMYDADGYSGGLIRLDGAADDRTVSQGSRVDDLGYVRVMDFIATDDFAHDDGTVTPGLYSIWTTTDIRL